MQENPFDLRMNFKPLPPNPFKQNSLPFLMRKMRIWYLRTKTENLYRVQTLKNLQQQLDYSANFPDFITPCLQEALSLLTAGFLRVSGKSC